MTKSKPHDEAAYAKDIRIEKTGDRRFTRVRDIEGPFVNVLGERSFCDCGDPDCAIDEIERASRQDEAAAEARFEEAARALRAVAIQGSAREICEATARLSEARETLNQFNPQRAHARA